MKKPWFVVLAILLSVTLTPWAQAAPVRVRILYVNDFHGFAEPSRPLGGDAPLGGIAYLAGAVDRARRNHPGLLLAAGDMIQGNAWANLFQGKSVIAVMNAMKFDAMVVGNHEFNFGPKALKARIAQANFPILGANVEGLPALKPYVIEKVNGLRIGIIGVVTRATRKQNRRNVAGLKFVTPASALHKYLPIVRPRADIILVLSHCGYPVDRKLAARVPGLDVIVGGHTHTKLLHPAKVGQTIIVQAWEHAKALGILDLEIDHHRIVGFQGHLEEISPAREQPDPKIQALVAHYEALAQPPLRQVIGETRVDLDARRVRTQESNLGDFIADVMRQVTGAQVAIINAGGIKGSIPRGRITLQDIYTLLPYDNYLIALRLTGAQLKKVLEHAVSHAGKSSHRFPQVSGLTFTYNPAAPVGSRVQDITVGGRPLQPAQTYTVATIDYLVAGGDGYQVFANILKHSGKNKVVFNEPGTWLRDRVIQAIRARKTLAPQVEGRIKTVN